MPLYSDKKVMEQLYNLIIGTLLNLEPFMRSFFAIFFTLIIFLSPSGITDKILSQDPVISQSIESLNKFSLKDIHYPFLMEIRDFNNHSNAHA